MNKIILILLLCLIVIVSVVVLLNMLTNRSLCVYHEPFATQWDNINEYILNNTTYKLLNDIYLFDIPIIDYIYPVGSLYITTKKYDDLSVLFPNTKWELLPDNLYLKTTKDNNTVGQIDRTTTVGKSMKTKGNKDWENAVVSYKRIIRGGGNESTVNMRKFPDYVLKNKSEPAFIGVYIWKRLYNDDTENNTNIIDINYTNILNYIYPVDTVIITVNDSSMYPSKTWESVNDVFIKSSHNQITGGRNIEPANNIQQQYGIEGNGQESSETIWPANGSNNPIYVFTKDVTVNKDNADTRPQFINYNIFKKLTNNDIIDYSKSLIDNIFPIGYIMLSLGYIDLNDVYKGTTWQLIQGGYYFGGNDSTTGMGAICGKGGIKLVVKGDNNGILRTENKPNKKVLEGKKSKTTYYYVNVVDVRQTVIVPNILPHILVKAWKRIK